MQKDFRRFKTSWNYSQTEACCSLILDPKKSDKLFKYATITAKSMQMRCFVIACTFLRGRHIHTENKKQFIFSDAKKHQTREGLPRWS